MCQTDEAPSGDRPDPSMNIYLRVAEKAQGPFTADEVQVPAGAKPNHGADARVAGGMAGLENRDGSLVAAIAARDPADHLCSATPVSRRRTKTAPSVHPHPGARRPVVPHGWLHRWRWLFLHCHPLSWLAGAGPSRAAGVEESAPAQAAAGLGWNLRRGGPRHAGPGPDGPGRGARARSG